VEETAGLYSISTDTLYRALRERAVPKPMGRCDQGVPRVMNAKDMERFCEAVAAIKVRTANRKGGICRPPRPSACWRTTAYKRRGSWIQASDEDTWWAGVTSPPVPSRRAARLTPRSPRQNSLQSPSRLKPPTKEELLVEASAWQTLDDADTRAKIKDYPL
jgi:hypothetical protein